MPGSLFHHGSLYAVRRADHLTSEVLFETATSESLPRATDTDRGCWRALTKAD
jgi:hypothetical protein